MVSFQVLLNISDLELEYSYELVQSLLGGVAINVDIDNDEYKVLLRKALRVYLYELNTYQLRNIFDDAKGLEANTDFTMRYVYDNGMMAKRVSDWFASMSRVGGIIPWKQDYITVQPRKQRYDLSKDSSVPFRSGERVYHRVLWYGRPEIRNNTQTLFTNNLFSFGQAGMNNPGYTLGFLGNVFDTILIAASLEERAKVLTSEFFYQISGDIISFSPRPDTNPSMQVGDRIFYYYFDAKDLQKLSDEDQKLIINPYQVQINEVNWSELNSMARNWIEDYAIALGKYLQGAKWRKIRKIASPGSDYDVELDYESLIEESKTEQRELKEDLRTELEKIDKWTMMEKKKEYMENASKINQMGGRPFLIG